MDIDKTAIGIRIKSIRLEKGLTLHEFGDLIDGADRSIASRWERGISLPNNERLKKIANLGGISVDELLYGTFDSFVYTIYNDIMNDEYAEGYLRFEASALREIQKADINRFKEIFNETLDYIKELGYSYGDESEIKERFYEVIFDYYHNEEPTNTGLINHVKRVLFNLSNHVLIGYSSTAKEDNPISDDLISELKAILSKAHKQVEEISSKYSNNDQK